MKNISLTTLVAHLAIAAETDATAAALANVMTPKGVTFSVASASADVAEHAALDAAFDMHFRQDRGAPGWAHALLDFLWDLLA